MVLNRKIIRTVLENKSRYIGAVILIFLCSTLFISLNIAGPSALEGIREFRKKHNVEEAGFVMHKPLENIPDIEKKYGLILEERKSVDYKYDKSSTLRLLEETKKLNTYSVVEGKALKGSGEILIDEKFASKHSIKVGSNIDIYGKVLKVAGFMAIPDYIYVLEAETDLIPNPQAFGVAIVSQQDISAINNGHTCYCVKFNKDNMEEFKKYLNSSNVIIKWLSAEDNPRISAVDGDVGSFSEMGKVVPVVIMVLTCLMVSIVLWRLLKVEFVQIGTLYSLGYRKSEILMHYLSYAVLLSALGGVAGILPGILLAKPLVGMQEIQYNFPNLEMNYDIRIILTGILLPFLFLIPVTVLVVMNALKLTPLELIRGGGNKTRVGFLERSLNLGKLKFDIKFKIRDMLRNIPRSAFMTLGVAFASALLLFGFVLMDSISGLVDDSYNKAYRYEYFYRFNTIFQGSPDVGEKTSVSVFTSHKINGDIVDYKIQGMQKDSAMINLKDVNGNALKFDKIIVTRPLAEKLGIKEGTSIKAKNKINSEEAAITIDKIADTYIGDFIFMPIDSFNEASGYPEGSYSGVLSREKLSYDSSKLISILSRSEIIEGYNAITQPLKLVVWVIGLLAFLIGLILIYVVTSLVIEENKMNISLLKILGYERRRIFSLVLSSNTILVVTGYLFSVPVIVQLVGKLLEIITAEMDITIPARLNWLNIIIGFIIMMFTYELSKLLSRKKVTGISMADSLKSRIE